MSPALCFSTRPSRLAWLLLAAMVALCQATNLLVAPSLVRVGETFNVQGTIKLQYYAGYLGLFSGTLDASSNSLSNFDLVSDHTLLAGTSWTGTKEITFSSAPTPDRPYYVCFVGPKSLASTHMKAPSFCSDPITLQGPQRPVVLIPGVCGSIITAHNVPTNHNTRVWIVLLNAMDLALEFMAGAWSKATNVFTSLVQSTHPDTWQVGPVQSNSGLDGIDILDPDFPANQVPQMQYWHVVIQGLKLRGYQAGKTLFGFPYDWRQSTRSPAVQDSLIEKLKTASNDGATPVDVITHSMGGLVFKSFLATNRALVEKYVHRWVCVAAPFLGGGGTVLNGIMNGYNMGHPFIDPMDARKLLLTTGSFYELIPAYDQSKWAGSVEGPPSLSLTPKDASGLHTFPGDSFVAPTRALTADNSWTYDFNGLKATLQYPAFPDDLWANAQETHRLWDAIAANGGLPASVDFVLLYSEGQNTHYNVTYSGKEVDYTSVHGDGTVPRISAISHGLGPNTKVTMQVVSGDHVGLLRTDSMVHTLVNIINPLPNSHKLLFPWLASLHPVLAALLAVCAVAVLVAAIAFSAKLLKNYRERKEATAAATPLHETLLAHQATIV